MLKKRRDEQSLGMLSAVLRGFLAAFSRGGCSILEGLHSLWADQSSSQQPWGIFSWNQGTPQHQCTGSARGAWWYPLIPPFEIAEGRVKGSFIFEQLAKALRDAQLHQSLQVFVFPHPNQVSLNIQPCTSPSHVLPLLPAVPSSVQCWEQGGFP